ncbi:ABC transporter substrate-binding protein [Desulfopila inferna]|uniref:ABC transporter substrate-binding protein n=1 Tax=Desulfopila inferna TaxID=468528 RepID=UPI001962F34A|nr:cobalamin-binding protein [Desulfopila inferna]MBM9604453.1 cobalamin-binding protein [Desulfopila inferna]
MKILGSLLLIYFFFLTLTVAPLCARLVVDQTGEKIELPAGPTRVLSLAPSLTEMVYSLEAEDKLVGATRYSNFPAAAKKLPRVGSYVQLDLERIVAIKPDLCIAIKDGNPRRTVDAIKALGIPVFAIDPRSIEQIMEAFLLLGDILGVSKKAEELVSDMEHRLLLVKEKVASSRTRPRVFFQIADSPIVSAGKDSYIDRIITLAGGSNLAGSLTEYPRFSWENIMLLQPEVVLISSMAGGKSPDLLKASWQRWSEIPAVKSNRIYVVNADLFNRPTVRLITGLEILAEILHPEDSGESLAK